MDSNIWIAEVMNIMYRDLEIPMPSRELVVPIDNSPSEKVAWLKEGF